MLGKCLWKMHDCSDYIRSNHERIGFEPAITAFKTAIETFAERRDNKHPEKDPTLEPHYKLVSVVHKLVASKRLPVSQHSSAEPVQWQTLISRAGRGRLPAPKRHSSCTKSTASARLRRLGRVYLVGVEGASISRQVAPQDGSPSETPTHPTTS